MELDHHAFLNVFWPYRGKEALIVFMLNEKLGNEDIVDWIITLFIKRKMERIFSSAQWRLFDIHGDKYVDPELPSWTIPDLVWYPMYYRGHIVQVSGISCIRRVVGQVKEKEEISVHKFHVSLFVVLSLIIIIVFELPFTILLSDLYDSLYYFAYSIHNVVTAFPIFLKSITSHLLS